MKNVTLAISVPEYDKASEILEISRSELKGIYSSMGIEQTEVDEPR